LWMNSEVGYLHNYKCGGSSVQDALTKLSQIDLRGESFYDDPRRGRVNLYGATPKFLTQSGWRNDPEPWYRKMSELFLFSFVRDPVDKFLSSFYEVHTRNHSSDRVWRKLEVDQYSGIERMRNLLRFFRDNTRDHMIRRKGYRSGHGIRGSTVWRGEPHFHPQMLFLWRRDFQFLPFDYIGEMAQFERALTMILDEFSDHFHEWPEEHGRIIRHLRRREEEQTKGRYHRKQHYEGAVGKEYFITREDLSDEDFEAICDVYWMDYICLPFDVPKQCDIEKMMDKYYGHFVRFNECFQ